MSYVIIARFFDLSISFFLLCFHFFSALFVKFKCVACSIKVYGLKMDWGDPVLSIPNR